MKKGNEMKDDDVELRRELSDVKRRLATELQRTHRIECEGAFSIDRDPFDVMPAIEAYSAGQISGGKMREYLRRWLAGERFRQAGTLDHEQT